MHGTESPQIEGYNTTFVPSPFNVAEVSPVFSREWLTWRKNSKSFIPSANSYVSGQIALLVSHRFSTVRMADRIVVLQYGTILEGTHAQLLSNNNLYAKLFRVQAEGYQ
jgi:hypothetical protein